ncbi:MAG TPA: hypothetical protein VKV33_09855, partial [Streptosporangiaceae bacterium]|nr:hypothetical protein [Streptosporangiaceae bacterium]
MGSHRPRHPRRRGEGRHTSLVGDPEYEEYGPAPAPGTGEPGAGGIGRGIPAAGAWEPAYGESRTSLVGGPPGNRPGERYVEGGWPRVWSGEYRPAGHAEDTVVLGDFGLFERFPGRASGPRGADPSRRRGGFGG